ncbi:MAG: vanadium-dependent haloperoxidase [Bryobacteraceae bacterium]
MAESIVQWRSTDGFTSSAPSYTGGSEPGQWRPTPPAFAFGLAPQFATITPWIIKTPGQFRPPGPPRLNSFRYTTDFNETKSMGSPASASRTPEQTLYAQFWNSAAATYLWNRVAVSIAAERNFTLSDNARLLATLNIAIADGAIACWDAKYTYSFWRPVTAIPLADTDNNPYTQHDSDWTPLLITPPFPEYPSAHSVLSSAALSVLAVFFGENTSFIVESYGMPGVTRSFTDFSSAAVELKNARIFGGLHFRTACNHGEVLGRDVGEYVLDHSMRRRHDER